jgi:U6 snRNA-associated Sm-like protein LSm6
MADGGDVSQSAKTPADFLKSIKGKPVVVKLNSGVDYRGTPFCLDAVVKGAQDLT